jgi:hypothetical protein
VVEQLHGAHPGIPILVACWGLRDMAGVRAALHSAGAADVVTSLAEALGAVGRLTAESARRSQFLEPAIEPT